MHAASASAQPPQPPIAKTVPHRLEAHGHVRTDDYYWLNQRNDPEVVDYLERENAYTQAVMAHTEDLQGKLFEEMKGRIVEDDESVPYRLDGYYYYTRYREGCEYALYCRKKGSLEADEEIVLDVEGLAKGQNFCSVIGVQTSPDHRVVAYAIDVVGRRQYTLRFVDLERGVHLDDAIENVTGNTVWAADSRNVFYAVKDPQTLRSYRVYRHEIGEDAGEDALVYEEQDDTFTLRVMRTKSRKFLLMKSSQTLRDEYRYLPSDEPTGTWRVFLPRQGAHEHDIDHVRDRWYIRSNDGAENFRLFSAPEDDPARAGWTVVIPHSEDVYLDDFALFSEFLVVSERSDGLRRIRVAPFDGGEEHYLSFAESVYWAGLSMNAMADTSVLRVSYTSLTTPPSVYDYDMRTRKLTLLKRDRVLGGFDPADYESARLHAVARDGTEVPISIVHRRGLAVDSSNPLLLYGYGSYGFTIDPAFRSTRLSLLDRGFVFAIAHVRGGQINGRPWYDDGKLLAKKNTFTDFIDVAEYLVEKGYTAPERLFAEGGSAGGLLMGAVMNMRPDLFKGVVAGVPFVDVVTTMLDDSIPLTTSEYDEWGDPRKKEYYDYMLSYSPYDNVRAQSYPHLLVTTGLHDSQVQYWEPAKWVAKLRATAIGDNRVLLKTDMDAGHGGASGRFERLRVIALEFAFLLDLAGRAR